jgi:hypothetical protein
MLGFVLMLRVLPCILRTSCVLALTLAFAPTSQATIIYQTGFESPFVLGSLSGQQGWSNSGTQFQIQNTRVQSGTQALELVNAPGGSNPFRAISYNSADNPETLVVAEWDFWVDSGTTQTMGVNLFRGDGLELITAMDLRGGRVALIVFSASGVPVTRTSFASDTWNRYRVEIDFSSTAVTAYLNNTLIGSGFIPFSSLGFLQFGATGGSSGVFFDNLSITSTTPNVVPEPGTWAMLAAGLAGLTLLRRRRA